MGIRGLCWTNTFLLCVMSFFASADQLPLSERSGLKRFVGEAKLPVSSHWDIRNVRIGHSVLDSAEALQIQGGKVHYITGGSRSRRVKVSFFQPFSGATLEQELTLNFDKDKGFINDVTLSYTLDDAYMAITPVYEQVETSALAKYGTPLSMDEVRNLSGSESEDVRLNRFVAALQQNTSISTPAVAFFSARQITRTSGFSADPNGAARLLYGFRECLLWHKNAFEEILTLCKFKGNSGNQRGQGIELSLRNFAVDKQILDYQIKAQDDVSLTF